MSYARKPLVHSREFWCDTCQIKEPMDKDGLKKHLKEAHQLEGKVTGKKERVCCLDMEGGQYANTFSWTLGGSVKITETSSGTIA